MGFPLINMSQILSQQAPVKPYDPNETATNAAKLSQLQGAGQLQQQAIATGADTANQRAIAAQKQAKLQQVLAAPGALGKDGTPTPATFAAISQIDPDHAAKLMEAFGVDPKTVANNAHLGAETAAIPINAAAATANAAAATSNAATAASRLGFDQSKPIVVNQGDQAISPNDVKPGAPFVNPKPATQTEFDQKIAAFNADSALTGKYGQGPNGYEKWQQDQRIAAASAGATARQNATASDDPRLKDVDPKVQSAVLDKVQKVEAAFNAAQRAGDDLGSFVTGAKAGNKVAAQYSPVEAVLQINAGAGVKRINRQEIDQMAGAGSIFDRIAGWAGHATEGQPVPKEILADMENLSKLLAGNAKTQHDRDLLSIDNTYRSHFAPTGGPKVGDTKTFPNGKTGKWDGQGWVQQ